jgi:hypothetical protein
VRLQEQTSITGRARADLQVAHVCIEVKLHGLFDHHAIERYRRYAKAARASDREYLYLTGGEGHDEYRTGILEAFGRGNAFFLDRKGHWNRFVVRLSALLRAAPQDQQTGAA